MPTDPTLVSAFATILQAGIVGVVLILLIAGVFRFGREVDREKIATADAVKREEAANTRNDKTITQLERVSDALDRLVAAIDKLVAKGP